MKTSNFDKFLNSYSGPIHRCSFTRNDSTYSSGSTGNTIYSDDKNFWELMTFGMDSGSVNKLLHLRNAVCKINWSLSYSARLKFIADNAKELNLVEVMKYLPHEQAKIFLLNSAQRNRLAKGTGKTISTHIISEVLIR